MQIARNLHRIGSDLVNSYLVVDGDDVTIVDAGLPGYWNLLEQELAAIGKTMANVRALVLTHGDSDHIGFAARLHQEKDITTYLHPDDLERARLQPKKPRSSWGDVKIGPMAGFLWYTARHGGLRIPPVESAQAMADGEVLDVPGRPTIIHVPGHTDGSVAVWLAGHDALLIGDAMATRGVLSGVTGPRLAPFTLDPAQALGSLDRLAAVNATWVLPGHGPAWDGGAPEAVRLAREAAALAGSQIAPGSRPPAL